MLNDDFGLKGSYSAGGLILFPLEIKKIEKNEYLVSS